MRYEKASGFLQATLPKLHSPHPTKRYVIKPHNNPNRNKIIFDFIKNQRLFLDF